MLGMVLMDLILHKQMHFLLNRYEFSNQELVWLHEIARKNKTILAVFASPYSLLNIKSFANLEAVLVAYQNSEIAQEITAQTIFGAIEASGKLPISIKNEDYRIYVEENGQGIPLICQHTAALSANVTVDSVICFGESNGSMLLEGIGGTAPYIIDYGTDPFTGLPVNENQLSEGTYSTTITDANGCASYPSFFNVYIPEPAELIVNPITTQVLCHNSGNGSISLAVSGGTGQYYYNWTGSLAGFTTPIISNLYANTYFVEVTDENGCSSDPTITTAIVGGPSFPLSVAIAPTNPSCFGGVDGQAQAFPTGGTPPYSYVWSDGQTGVIASGLSSGSYKAFVIDANGCNL